MSQGSRRVVARRGRSESTGVSRTRHKSSESSYSALYTINYDPEGLVQPHLRVGQGDFAEERDDLLDRGGQEWDEDGAVKVPRVAALGEAPGGGEPDRGVG